MMTNLGKRKTLIVVVAAVLVAGIGFGAGMMAKSALASEKHDIGAEEAKVIALSNVGVSAEKATFTKAVLDDDGYYDVEFYTSSTSYDFEIDAATGAVLEKDAEARKVPDKEESAEQKDQTADKDDSYVQQTKPTESQTSTSNDASVIGVAAAKNIALKHAGVSSATFTKAYLDHDDGVRVYEIEFTAGNIEYDYEIHAYKGTILDYDKDYIEYDDDDDDDDEYDD